MGRERLRACRGLIPTHAGKTGGVESLLAGVGAHPHSRGENLNGGCLIAPGQGSSPLTRGKQSLSGADADHDRLIPTHAGKTRR